jgi:EAL domain-containing protein (putative c-di-GMP-specific phosphodiesterase class I)
VETEEIRARIATLGVDYGQGFAIGRPAPLVDLLIELPLLVSATAVTRSLSQTTKIGDTDDNDVLSIEFAH